MLNLIGGIMAKSIPDQVTDRLIEEKQISDTLEISTSRLYSLRCFETMTHANGVPIAMRVPGGWIFYFLAGGGRLSLQVGDGEEEEQILGEMKGQMSQVFVPYSDEFEHGCERIDLLKVPQ